MFILQDFMSELKEIRVKKRIKVKDVAEKMNVTSGTIHRIESGHIITVGLLQEYLEVIGLDLRDIFRE